MPKNKRKKKQGRTDTIPQGAAQGGGAQVHHGSQDELIFSSYFNALLESLSSCNSRSSFKGWYDRNREYFARFNRNKLINLFTYLLRTEPICLAHYLMGDEVLKLLKQAADSKSKNFTDDLIKIIHAMEKEQTWRCYWRFDEGTDSIPHQTIIAEITRSLLDSKDPRLLQVLLGHSNAPLVLPGRNENYFLAVVSQATQFLQEQGLPLGNYPLYRYLIDAYWGAPALHESMSDDTFQNIQQFLLHLLFHYGATSIGMHYYTSEAIYFPYLKEFSFASFLSLLPGNKQLRLLLSFPGELETIKELAQSRQEQLTAQLLAFNFQTFKTDNSTITAKSPDDSKEPKPTGQQELLAQVHESDLTTINELLFNQHSLLAYLLPTAFLDNPLRLKLLNHLFLHAFTEKNPSLIYSKRCDLLFNYCDEVLLQDLVNDLTCADNLEAIFNKPDVFIKTKSLVSFFTVFLARIKKSPDPKQLLFDVLQQWLEFLNSSRYHLTASTYHFFKCFYWANHRHYVPIHFNEIIFNLYQRSPNLLSTILFTFNVKETTPLSDSLDLTSVSSVFFSSRLMMQVICNLATKNKEATRPENLLEDLLRKAEADENDFNTLLRQVILEVLNEAYWPNLSLNFTARADVWIIERELNQLLAIENESSPYYRIAGAFMRCLPKQAIFNTQPVEYETFTLRALRESLRKKDIGERITSLTQQCTQIHQLIGSQEVTTQERQRLLVALSSLVMNHSRATQKTQVLPGWFEPLVIRMQELNEEEAIIRVVDDPRKPSKTRGKMLELIEKYFPNIAHWLIPSIEASRQERERQIAEEVVRDIESLTNNKTQPPKTPQGDKSRRKRNKKRKKNSFSPKSVDSRETVSTTQTELPSNHTDRSNETPTSPLSAHAGAGGDDENDPILHQAFGAAFQATEISARPVLKTPRSIAPPTIKTRVRDYQLQLEDFNKKIEALLASRNIQPFIKTRLRLVKKLISGQLKAIEQRRFPTQTWWEIIQEALQKKQKKPKSVSELWCERSATGLIYRYCQLQAYFSSIFEQYLKENANDKQFQATYQPIAMLSCLYPDFLTGDRYKSVYETATSMSRAILGYQSDAGIFLKGTIIALPEEAQDNDLVVFLNLDNYDALAKKTQELKASLTEQGWSFIKEKYMPKLPGCSLTFQDRTGKEVDLTLLPGQAEQHLRDYCLDNQHSAHLSVAAGRLLLTPTGKQVGILPPSAAQGFFNQPFTEKFPEGVPATLVEHDAHTIYLLEPESIPSAMLHTSNRIYFMKTQLKLWLDSYKTKGHHPIRFQPEEIIEPALFPRPGVDDDFQVRQCFTTIHNFIRALPHYASHLLAEFACLYSEEAITRMCEKRLELLPQYGDDPLTEAWWQCLRDNYQFQTSTTGTDYLTGWQARWEACQPTGEDTSRLSPSASPFRPNGWSPRFYTTCTSGEEQRGEPAETPSPQASL